MAFAQADADNNRLKHTISVSGTRPSGSSASERSKVKRARRQPGNVAEEDRADDAQMDALTFAS